MKKFYFLMMFSIFSSLSYASLIDSWSGYHDSSCSWLFGTSSFSAPTTYSNDCLHERVNNTFGTVVSWNDGTPGNDYPGITFTPNKTGRYFVCAEVVAEINGGPDKGNLELTDGTAIVAKAEVSLPAGYEVTLPLCGIYEATSTSPVTLQIKGKSPTQNVLVHSSASDDVITWSIFQID